MATVRLSNSNIADIKSHMKNQHYDKAQTRWISAVDQWRKVVTPHIDKLAVCAIARSMGSERSWEVISDFVYVQSINGTPLTYITPDAPNYRALHNNAYYFKEHYPVTLAIQSGSITKEVGNFGPRWYGSSDYQLSSAADIKLLDDQLQYKHLKLAYFGRIGEIDGATYTLESVIRQPRRVGSWATGYEEHNRAFPPENRFQDPETRRIPMAVAVPMHLPLPARLPDNKRIDDFENGSIFEDMQNYIAKIGTAAKGTPEVTLTGACSPNRGQCVDIRYFVNFEGIPKADEQAIRDGLQQAGDILAPSLVTITADEELTDLLKLVDMYKSVNAMVRDVPTMFSLLPPYIQTKLREETPKRNRSNPDAPDKDKLEELKRKAMAHHLS